MRYTCGAQKVYILQPSAKDAAKAQEKDHANKKQEKTLVGVGTSKQLTDLQNLVESALLA